MSRIITFYSYKGGVGRSMALANVGVLLAKWGYRTLLVDWDLEAPGLENFFFKDKKSLEKARSHTGLIDLLTARKGSKLKWQDLLQSVTGHEKLQLITAGKQTEDYSKKVRTFDVGAFYDKQDGGLFLEKLRKEWLETFDFVLLDSRTGITDLGAICTVQLPDFLVLLFTATHQGFEGIVNVARRVAEAQRKMPLERAKIISLPVPSRFDTISEFKRSQEWLELFAAGLGDVYKDWLPKSVAPRDFLERTKVPYQSYFSFGETLPVVEQGTSDSTGLGYAYENLAAILANGFEQIEEFVEDRAAFVERCKLVKNGNGSIQQTSSSDTIKVLIFYGSRDTFSYKKLKERLLALSDKIEVFDDDSILPGMSFQEEINRMIFEADVFVVLISESYLESPSLLDEVTFLTDKLKKRPLIPVYFQGPILPVKVPAIYKSYKAIASAIDPVLNGQIFIESPINSAANSIVDSIEFLAKNRLKK